MKKRTRTRKKLETWLNSVTTPVFLLSADRQILFFNSGCEQLTGRSSEELIGHICDYASHDETDSLETVANNFCPPPKVCDGREMNVPAYFPHPSGELLTRLIRFIPLKTEDGRVESILGVITSLEQPVQSAAISSAHLLHAELTALKISLRQQFGLKSLVCQSLAMKRVMNQIQLAGKSRSTLFFHGEKGTGKEHIARLIHYENDSHSSSFVPLDCAQLPALQLKHSLQRLFSPDEEESSEAQTLPPGTLYLANVESLPRDLQSDIVKVYSENGTVIGIRLACSSSIDLQAAVDDDRLRPDFFYLITQQTIELPALRERREDLSALAQHFVEQFNRGSENQVGGFDDAVWDQLYEYNWPGNLDELAMVVEEARDACNGNTIRVADLPFRFRTGLDAQSVAPVVAPQQISLDQLLAEVETEQITNALQHSRNNKSKAAELLGLTRAKLYRRMEQLDIDENSEPTN